MILDSNVVIYACGAGREGEAARAFVERHGPSASAVTVVETLGYHRLGEVERAVLTAFFDSATVYPVTADVIREAVRLRQQRRLSLGDAFVAGTALALGLPLATRNLADFRWIGGLVLVDPFA